MVYGAGNLELIIEESDGGYCTLGAGTYYFEQQDEEISLFAYAYPNYYFSGWIIDGDYENESNPLYIDLNNDAPVSMTVSPAFSTQPTHLIYIYGASPVYVTINDIEVQASVTGTSRVFQAGTTITVRYIDDPDYDFNSFRLYGTTTITEKTFDFVLSESTMIHIHVTYDPVYVVPPLPEEPPTFPPIIAPDLWTLENLINIVPSGIIIGTLGLAFSQLGSRLDDHDYAGFLIGGCIGLLLCTVQGLIPVWFTVFVFFCGSIAIYFWFRSGT